MRPDLLEILCCPVCKGDLTLVVVRKDRDEILEGTLKCPTCPADYPIQDGIPDLLPPSDRD